VKKTKTLSDSATCIQEKWSSPASGAIVLRLQNVSLIRVFKTKWFSKAAKYDGIKISQLCRTIAAVMQGKADASGGGA